VAGFDKTVSSLEKTIEELKR